MKTKIPSKRWKEQRLDDTFGIMVHNVVSETAHDANGAAWRATTYDYDAFGNERGTPDATDQNSFRYCGEYHDAETGTIYLRARYYDPVVGRFTQRDMVFGLTNKLLNGQQVFDPLSLHQYTYTHNNPLMNVDPTGLFSWNNLIGGSFMTYMGYGVVTVGLAALTVATGGLALVVAGGTVVAGGGMMVLGASQMVEGVTDYNPVRDTLFESNPQLYYDSMMATSMAGAAGAQYSATYYQMYGYRQWYKPDGSINWPTNNGFEGAPQTSTLSVGARIDRYGYETGTFASPEGVPYSMRSLAPNTDPNLYNVYEVIKPIDVLSGKAAPWFGELGGGVQYKLPSSVQALIEQGYLRKVG